MSLWKLEVLRLWRTQRWLILLAVFVSFGILGPVTARYLPDLLEALGEETAGSFAAMTAVDGVTQYIGNAAQIGLLAVVFVAAAALAFDAKPEIAVFLRTRASISEIVISRFVVASSASIGAFWVGMVVAYVLTGILLAWVNAGAVTVGAILFGFYLGFAVAVVAVVASFIRSVPGVALLSLGILIVLALLGLVPQLAPWLPSEPVGATDVLIRGGGFEFWRALLTTIVLSVLLLMVSIRRLEQREM
jgi:ABC-2 type transport system permease protein